MRLLSICLLLHCLTSCLQQGPSTQRELKTTDSPVLNSLANVQPDTAITNKIRTDTLIDLKIDTALLLRVSEKILFHIKTKNYKKLSLFFHPREGVRFSPYAYIDTIKDRKLHAIEFLNLVKGNRPIDWNSSWEKEAELLTIDKYFKKFVYDVNFLSAKLKSINKYHSQGTDLNNIGEVYIGCPVVEFFFPGFDKKYGGLDFRGLRLAYKRISNQLYLVGVVHDQWTP